MPGEEGPFHPESYDVIVVLQVHEAFHLVPPDHPNVVFVPMYDSLVWEGCFYWSQAFERGKVLCFSSALYHEVTRRTERAAWFQYFPNPEELPAVEDYGEPRGFCWLRRRETGPHLIRRLAEATEFETFHVHAAPDPGEELPQPAAVNVRSREFTVSSWFDSRAGYLEQLRSANIYFAPRRIEGIGMGFLEAMAMGLCVVAPDTPTHNEYISPGVNGVLYDPHRPEPADLSRFSDLGRRARESIERGRRRWEAALDDLFDFILTPTARFRRKRFLAGGWLERPEPAVRPAAPDSESWPAVTVAVYGDKPVRELGPTVESVLRQDYPHLGCLVITGEKSGPPMDVIERGPAKVVWVPSASPVTPAAAADLALEKSGSEWFLFLEPGQILAAPDALRRLLANAPAELDIAYGHCIERSPSGADEHFRTWGLPALAERLAQGSVDLRWLAGTPAVGAIAWRRRLLESHRPDPALRKAAWADLLFRAHKAGIRAFHADEFVSAAAGGEPAWQSQTGRMEWIDLAERHGGAAAGEAMRKALGAGDGEWSVFRAGLRAERRVREAFGGAGGKRVAGALRTAARTARRSMAALRWRAAALAGKSRAALPAHLDLKAELVSAVYDYYPASLEEGAVFSRPGLPEFLRSAEGLSLREEWGRWSDGGRVEFQFRTGLPRRFRVLVRGYAVGENVNHPIRVRAGRCTKQLRMGRAPARDYEVFLDSESSGQVRTLVFEVPFPATPAELWGGPPNDLRKLGIAFERLAIRPA